MGWIQEAWSERRRADWEVSSVGRPRPCWTSPGRSFRFVWSSFIFLVPWMRNCVAILEPFRSPNFLPPLPPFAFFFHFNQWNIMTYFYANIQNFVKIVCMCVCLCYLLNTPYISRGFYFRESGATREINNARKNIYLWSRRMNATCIHSARTRRLILLVLYWLLRLLLSSIANLTTRKNVLKFWFAKD